MRKLPFIAFWMLGLLSGCSEFSTAQIHGVDVRYKHDDIQHYSTYQSDEASASFGFDLHSLRYTVRLQRKEMDRDHEGSFSVVLRVYNSGLSSLRPELGRVSVFAASDGEEVNVKTTHWESFSTFGAQIDGYDLTCDIEDAQLEFFRKHRAQDIKIRVVTDQTGALTSAEMEKLAVFVDAFADRISAGKDGAAIYDKGDDLETKKRKLEDAINKM